MANDPAEKLKADLPPTLWGKVLGVTPVAMTVIATVLAGLASSEMNRAQYDRSLGAQLQSKASDQWNFFQAKKLRSAMQSDTADLLEAMRPPAAPATPPPTLPAGGPGMVFSTVKPPALPVVKSSLPDMAPDVQTALQAFQSGRPEDEVQAKVAVSDPDHLAAALKLAEDRTVQFDAEIARAASASSPIAQRRFTAARYDAEARLNQDVAGVYELQVRKSNQGAERHHDRSQLFFYGMLIAQMAVMISTFALAAKKRNVLWSLAAAAGAAALSFSIYVYLCI